MVGNFVNIYRDSDSLENNSINEAASRKPAMATYNPFHHPNNSVEMPLKKVERMPFSEITQTHISKHWFYSQNGNWNLEKSKSKDIPIKVRNLLKQRIKVLKSESSDENVHPNVANCKKMSKEITVFKNAFSPDEIKFSSSKRYKDHFIEDEEPEEEFSENDILYEICENEKRPSKEVTTINTGLSTLREDSKTNQREMYLDKECESSEPFQYNFSARNAKSSKELNKQYHHIEIKPKLAAKAKDCISSPNFSRMMVPLEENIEEIASMVQINISEKNTEKIRHIKQEEEKYEQDIKGLKKRLDFLNNSNCRLIESSLKHHNFRTITHSTEKEERRQSDYIYTERYSNDDVSPDDSRGPDIMQYVSEETLSKSK
jgi:hypothetical protein